MSTKDKLKKCLKEGEKGTERHKGIRKIKPDQERARSHLKKALHNLEAITAFHDADYSDWSASAAFYTLYHGLLAILAQRGYESRNQSCTFALTLDMISQEEIKKITKEEVKEIFDQDIEDLQHSRKILDIRERMQYSISTSLVEEEFKDLKQRTKQILDKIRLELERYEEDQP